MEEKYIKDKIGEKYTTWKNGDCIFISSPTGSGKTTFILKTLLPFLAKGGLQMLYLVNRRILKEQIVESIPTDCLAFIKVETYQKIEELIIKKEGKAPNVTVQQKSCDIWWDGLKRTVYDYSFSHDVFENIEGFVDVEYDYIVCDECHYFLTDSNYNTNTGLSFRFIEEKFWDKIRIYMSATIDDIKKYIQKKNRKKEIVGTFYYNYSPGLMESPTIYHTTHVEEDGIRDDYFSNQVYYSGPAYNYDDYFGQAYNDDDYYDDDYENDDYDDDDYYDDDYYDDDYENDDDENDNVDENNNDNENDNDDNQDNSQIPIEKTYRSKVEGRYDYINIGILNGDEDILKEVKRDNSKWLIFVDSIKYGKKLEKELKDFLQKS